MIMLKKIFALCAALLLALSALSALAETTATQASAAENAAAEAPAAEAPVSDDPVLATIGNVAIHRSEVEAIIPQLVQLGADGTDYTKATQLAADKYIFQTKVKEMGFDVFTEEEEAAFKEEASKQWEAALDSYISYYLSEDTEAARAEMKHQAETFYAGKGYSIDKLLDNVRRGAAFDRMNRYLIGDYKPTEEEIQRTFQQFGAIYQQNYENNIMAYEYNTVMGGQPSWYTPSGYRGIIHILIKPDADLLATYEKLSSRYEEAQNLAEGEPVGDASADPAATPAPTAEPVTKEAVDQARQAVLDSVKDKTDAIYARLAAGESFESLIAEYGSDPGMQDANSLANGYSVHKDSILWDPVFTEASYSDKVQKVGDVSDPVVGKFGVHIVKYQRDVPSGLVLTDSIRQEITDYLQSAKESTALQTALKDWGTQMGLVLNEEAIAAATAQAQAEAARLEEEESPLQAVPEGELEVAPATP